MRFFIVFILTVFFSFPASAGAMYSADIDTRTTDGEVRFNPLAGQYNFFFSRVSDFDVDANNTKNPIENWGEHRFLLAPSLNWRDIYFKVEADIWLPQYYGQSENFAAGYDRLDRREKPHYYEPDIMLRELFIQWHSPIGVLKIGHTTSSYGLGILSNNGSNDNDRFGYSRYGDIVERIMFVTTPFLPLTGKGAWGEYLALLVAGDLVYRDENADLLDGDIAINATVGVLYRRPNYENGFIFTYRWQEDDNGDDLKVFAFNLNGKNRFPFTAGDTPMELRFEYEAVALIGSTTRLQQLSTPEGIDIKSFGGVGRLVYELNSIGFDTSFELGYASGDNNPYDETSTAFFFDPDYNVGMIFFDEMLPLITARSVDELTDPARSTSSPKGLDLVASQGRATNTLYYMPQVRYRPPLGLNMKEVFEIKFAALILTTPSKFAQAYYTYENGGTPTNYMRKKTTSNYLGTELLTGISMTIWPLRDHIGTKLGLDFAYFMPGSALDAPNDSIDPVWKILMTIGLMWQ